MKYLLPNHWLYLPLVFIVHCLPASAQTTSTLQADSCPPRDIQDILFKRSYKEPFKVSKKAQIFVIPLVSYAPSTSLSFGAGSSLSWYMKDDSLTRISAAVADLQYTLLNQFRVQLKTNIKFPNNRFYLQTDWRWYIFNLPTYGLGTSDYEIIPEIPGTGNPSRAPELHNLAYPMDFNWLKFHNVLSTRVVSDFYIGIGYHFDYHYLIVDRLLDTVSGVITPHYAYSVTHDFDPLGYISSGVSANLVFDSRDNVINPYQGIYANVSYRYNPMIFGSSASGSQLWTEFRTYIGLSRKVPRHLIALWLYGSFLVSGSVPYLHLMATGYDQMNASGRGYPLGRWRGEDLVYGEVEYRFPISRCSNIIGGVVYANITTASNRDMDIPLFKFLQGAVGFGVRIMLNKQDRTNLVIDYGQGNESNGVYIQAQEVF